MAEANDLIKGTQRSTAEIRQDIAAKRESITGAVERLGEKIQGTFDWRSYVAKHPYAAVGVAAGTGLLVSGLFRRRTRPTDRIMDALAEAVHGVTGDARKTFNRMIVKTGTPIVVKSAVKAALTGAIAKAVSEFVHKQFTDGFDDTDRDYPKNVYSGQPPNPSGIS